MKETPKMGWRQRTHFAQSIIALVLFFVLFVSLGVSAYATGVDSTSWTSSDQTTSESIEIDQDQSVVDGTSTAKNGNVAPSGDSATVSSNEATQDSTSTGSDGAQQSATPLTERQVLSSQSTVASTGEMGTMAAGADGGSAPYITWNVRDAETGELVPGATFKLENRAVIIFGRWETGNDAGSIADCSGTCSTSTSGNSLDRDSDGGEFLLEHFGTTRSSSTRIVSGNRYRVSQVAAPAGYTWAVSGSNTKEVSSNGWSNRSAGIHDFGTFQVVKIRTEPMCEAGYTFGLSTGGQLQQVSPSGVVTNLGSPASSSDSYFNGLGIGSNGEVYSILRTASSGTSLNATVYAYDKSKGRWSSTGASTISLGGNTGTSLIAGAVDLSTNLYYFGGFTSNGNFKVYEYNPSASQKLRLKGTIQTSASSGSNGDMAFDSAGNLYIVRGEGSKVTVYSVTADNFRAANGGAITSSTSADFTVANGTNVNGIAFDSQGKGYLANGTEVRSYDMPGWKNGTLVSNKLVSSGDLASCSSPPTITIEKYVDGARVSNNDQFTLTLKQGSTTIGTATTTGSETGLQSERVGPLPTVRGVPLTFSETGAKSTNMSNYASSYRCYVDGVLDSSASGDGTTGTITIPTGAENVLCSFYNKPLVADISIEKRVADSVGENPTPMSGWSVGAQVKATTGNAPTVDGTTSQTTDASGQASWQVRFNKSDDRATVTVSETQKSGYEFLSGQCHVTHLDGSTVEYELTGEQGFNLTSIRPGDSVSCTYVNAPSPGALTITNTFDSTVPSGSGNIPFSGTYTCVLNDEVVASGTWTVTGTGKTTLRADEGSRDPNRIPAGASCSVVDKPAGGTSDGLPNESYSWKAATAGNAVTIASGKTSNLTVVNSVERIYGKFAIVEIVEGGGLPSDVGVVEGTWTCILGSETVTGSWGPLAQGETWTSDGNAIPLGASCSVTSKRVTDPSEGYQWDGSTKVSPPVTTVQDSNLENATITVENRTLILLGSVSWSKVDEDGSRLSHSEWQLTGPSAFNNGQPLIITDCYEGSECDSLDANSASGEFTINNLPWGQYTLKEIKAPAGYYLSSDSTPFPIGTGSLTVTLPDVVNYAMESPELPLTGGISRDLYVVVGSLLGLTGLGGMWWSRRRQH